MQSAISGAIADTGVTDPNALDKSYWMQKVGELSVQLEQNSDYWSKRARETGGQLQPRPPSSTSHNYDV